MSENIFHKPELERVLSGLTLSIPFTAIMTFFLAVTQGMKRMEYGAAIEKMVVPLLKICGVLLTAWLLGKRLIGTAFGITTASAAGAALAAAGVWRLYPLRGQARSPVFETKTLLAFSWPLLLTSVFERSGEHVETIVLGASASSELVGIYYVGLRTSVLLTAAFLALSSIFAPVMAELYGRGELERLSELLKTVTRWGVALSLPVSVLFVCLSEEIISIFGPEFIPGAAAVRWLALSQFLNVSTGPVGWLLIMSGHPRINLANTLLVLIVNVGLAFTFIPAYGIIGAAVCAAVSIAAANLLRLAEVYWLLRIHPYDLSFVKPLAAGLLSWALISCLKSLMADLSMFQRSGILSLVLLILYPAILLALRPDQADRVLLNACVQRISRHSSRKPETA